MEKGKISVIMGIYNCAPTLPDAVESILKQTYTNWELIMCDDASTDTTYEVAEQYRQQYPDKIVLIRNQKNAGLAYSLNHCLENASGEYVARMDADDESYPERFEKQVAYLKEHPEMQLVGTSVQQFCETGLSGLMLAPEKPNYYTLRRTVPFRHATILTYKSVYDALGGYTVSERTRRSQDKDLFFRFYHKGFTGGNLVEPLYLGRDDMAAVRRRTFSVRWNSFLIVRDGFKLLKYPKWWIIRPFFMTIFKSIVPYKLIYSFRKRNVTYQSK